MSYMRDPCIICHRLTPGLHHSRKKKAQEIMKRFFPLFESYVDDNYVMGVLGADWGKSGQLPLQKVSAAEILPCPDCLRIVESFCEWHEQLKSIEKMLNEKVGKLQALMMTAWRTPSIQTAFRTYARQANRVITERVVDAIMEHQEALIQKCERKLRPLRRQPEKKTVPVPRVTPVPAPVLKIIPSPASSRGAPCPKSRKTSIKAGPGILSMPVNVTKAVTILQDGIISVSKSKRSMGAGDHGTGSSPKIIKLDAEDAKSDDEGPPRVESEAGDSTLPKEEPDWDQNQGDNSDDDSDSEGHPTTDPLELPDSPQVKEEDDEDEDDQDEYEEIPPSPISATTSSKPSNIGTDKEYCTILETGECKCDLCGKVFPFKAVYNKHFAINHLNIRFQCEVEACGKLFTRSETLRQHTKEVHLKLRDHVCSSCGKGFGRLSNLQFHMRTVHSDAKEEFFCDQCGRGFQTAKYLKIHTEAVHVKNEYRCELCQRVFHRRGGLALHRRRIHPEVNFNDAGTIVPN